MKKFVRFKILSIEEQESEERTQAGFSDEPKKKKKKKAKPIVGDLIVALDSILSVAYINGDVELTTMEGTYLLADDVEYVRKVLKV